MASISSNIWERLPGTKCPECGQRFYSPVFNETECCYYCPDCGVPLVPAGNTIYAVHDHELWIRFRRFEANQKYYQSKKNTMDDQQPLLPL